MKFFAAIVLSGYVASAAADPRFAALSAIESGDNDRPPCADISRFCFSVPVWHAVTALPVSAATNPVTALALAEKLMAARTAHFTTVYHRPPTDAEWYLLWHRPARVLHPKPAEAERARRFAALVEAQP